MARLFSGFKKKILERYAKERKKLLLWKVGELLVDESIQEIQRYLPQAGMSLLSFTWVHNETGVVWPLSLATKIKMQTGALIHVDAAQAIGKVEGCFELATELDYYAFSSHKFGALKGHGFSLGKFQPEDSVLLGGSQQGGLRAGTESLMGAQAAWMALEAIETSYFKTQRKLIGELRSFVAKAIAGKGEVVCANATELNLNTCLFVLNNLPSDRSLPLFDLAGLELSAGAACSSGAAKASHVLEGLGLKHLAKNGLRLSTSWRLTEKDLESLTLKLSEVFKKIPS